jgi:hypothetical protein
MVTRVKASKRSAAESTAQRGQTHPDDWSHAVAGVLGLHGERMSKVDTAWLRMDSQYNLMMIVGVWVLRPGISHEALCVRLEERLLKYTAVCAEVWCKMPRERRGCVMQSLTCNHHVTREKLAAKAQRT